MFLSVWPVLKRGCPGPAGARVSRVLQPDYPRAGGQKKKASVVPKACPSMGTLDRGNARRLGGRRPDPTGLRHRPPSLRAFPRSKVPIDGHALCTTEAKKKGGRAERRSQTAEPNRERRPESPPPARPFRPAPPLGASPWFEVCLRPPGNPGGMKGGRWRKAGAFRPRQKLGSRADFQ